MKKSKISSSKLIVIIAFALIVGSIFLFLPFSANIAEAATGSNKITTRTNGTLNGILQKQEDGSITFNEQIIVSAEENLTQMYVILQGSGGAGGYYRLFVSTSSVYEGGASGAFALVKVMFNGTEQYIISSGQGGVFNESEKRYGVASSITLPGVGEIVAEAGESAKEAAANHGPDNTTRGGNVQIIDTSGTLSQHLSVVFSRNGKNGGHRDPVTPGGASLAFTLSMYKNGKLTTKFFNHYVGGLSQLVGGAGGAASPYGRGGNGGYSELLLDFDVDAEDGMGYGAGGGGSLILIDSYGGAGGNGFVEILG